MVNPDSFTLRQILSIRSTLIFRYNILIDKRSTYVKEHHNLYINAIWNEIEDSIRFTADRLYDIISSSDSETITIFFHKFSNSGFSNMGSRLKDRIFQSNYPDVPSYIHGQMKVDPAKAEEAGYSEVDGTAIQFENIREDGSNEDEFLRNIYSTVYYMVKYNAFIMVKEGKQFNNQINRNGFLIFGDLYNLYGNEITNTLRENPLSFGLSPKGQEMLDNFINGYYDENNVYHEGWNRNYFGMEFWSDTNTFPIWLFTDHQDFDERFETNFGYDIINLR